MEAAKSLPQTKFLPQTFNKLVEELPSPIKMDHELPVTKQSNATEPSGDIVALGETSLEEIDKLMEELRFACDYLRSEGERVRRINARYAHLTWTASDSVKVITESMGKWRVTEMEAEPRQSKSIRRTGPQ